MTSSNSTNKNLPLATPDFDSIKDSLKKFLSTQDELKDYDFDGSTMSVILDMLAYNSHMNAFMLNMVGNESFLSTSMRRSSVVNNARDLGYTPTSAKSASAILYLEYEPTGVPESSIIIPAGTAFGAATNGASYIFSTLDDQVAVWVQDIGRYAIGDVKVYEGRRFTHSYTVVSELNSGEVDTISDVTGVGISLPNLNVDASTLKVYVNDPGLATEFVLYGKYDGALGVNRYSNIYFTDEDEAGRVNIKFGDGVLGRKPGLASKIRIEYIVASGPIANGVALFNQTSAIAGASLTKVVPKGPSAGGALPESIESIKYNAPLSFESQDRGVIAEDYVYLTKQVYPNTKSVISWGGQDNDPPVFGKVFVSVQPKTGVIITKTDKNSIAAYLSKKGMMTITPVITDPDYTYIDVSTKVRYDANTSSSLGGTLEAMVANTIKTYGEVVLSTFKANLEFSRFLAAIDMTDPGILSNSSTLTINKRVYISDGIKQQATIKFCNAILENSISSSRFVYSGFENCRISSNSSGTLSIISEQAGNTITIVSDIGTVDYQLGSVVIRPLSIDSSDPEFFDELIRSPYIKITATPKTLNISTTQNQILLIDRVTVKSERV